MKKNEAMLERARSRRIHAEPEPLHDPMRGVLAPIWFGLTSEWSKLLFGMSSAGIAFTANNLITKGDSISLPLSIGLGLACTSFCVCTLFCVRAFDKSSTLIGRYLLPLDPRAPKVEQAKREKLDDALGVIKKVQLIAFNLGLGLTAFAAILMSR